MERPFVIHRRPEGFSQERSDGTANLRVVRSQGACQASQGHRQGARPLSLGGRGGIDSRKMQSSLATSVLAGAAWRLGHPEHDQIQSRSPAQMVMDVLVAALQAMGWHPGAMRREGPQALQPGNKSHH